MFRTNIVEKIKTHILCSINLFRKSYSVRYDVEKYGSTRQAIDDNIILRMPFAGWIIKVTDTYSEYVTLTGFPRQQCLANAPHFYVYNYIVHHVIYCIFLILVHAVNFVYTTSPTLLLLPAVSMKLSQN
jgi:hypothetical protein